MFDQLTETQLTEPTHSPADEYRFPADEEVEKALLGKVLIDQSMDGLDFLTPDDFYFGRHGELFSRMRSMWNGGVERLDLLLIADGDGELHSLAAEAMAVQETFTPAVAYARKVHDLAQKRRAIPIAQKIVEMSYNGASPASIGEYALAQFDSDAYRSDRDTWQVHYAAELIEPPLPREWLLEGLLFRGQVSMYYGPPGIRKTLLLMDMCAAMATGQNWLMRREWQDDHPTLTTFHIRRNKGDPAKAKPVRVLWLDYDNGEYETKLRIRAALSARGDLNAPFFYMSETTPWLALDNPSHVRRVVRQALDVAADVIVIDALGMVLGDVDENSPEVARVIAHLKEIRAATGAAIIAVHHPSKAGAQTQEANTYNAAGSAKFSNFFEWTIELRKGEIDGRIVASVVKHRGWAKTAIFAADFAYTHFGDEHPELAHELKTFRFYPAPLESAAEKRGQAIKDAVLSVLATGPMNQQELINAAKKEVDSAVGSPVGKLKIRDEIINMAAAGEIKAVQEAARMPILYSLA